MRFISAIVLTIILAPNFLASGADEWTAGFARVDVTPTEPVRMAGYGSRDHASEGIDTPLFVRCVALKSAADSQASLLFSVDTIGLPGDVTRELASAIKDKHGVERNRIVFCNTHTHAGPDLISELTNIFEKPLSDDEVAAGLRYKEQLKAGILESAKLALNDLAPAKFAYSIGNATFAANRRVLKDGRWSGFGVQADGVVDHSVPVLRITDDKGKIRGVIFNYACHCTTIGNKHYRINSDWAGYAAMDLEAQHDGAVALCTIGCGADANPEPRDSVDAAKIHGRTLSAEVSRLIGEEMQPINEPLKTKFGYAELPFKLPTKEELEERAANPNFRAQTRRHAERYLKVLQSDGRLPATHSVPIQSWQFGDQLTMIFLGGEVVADYSLRLKKELDDPKLWVTAYANDVPGYIASEKMIAEEGYEYFRSGIYYGLPGPWATGTEDLLIARIKETLKSSANSSTPFAGMRATIPGKIEAEHYDLGPTNVAYQDTEPENQGADYRESTQVDIEERDDASNGHGVGWTKKGEWLMYSVTVQKTGTYELTIPVASDGKGGSFHLEIEGKNVSGAIDVPDTGDWKILKTIKKDGIRLTAGDHKIKMVMDSEGESKSTGDIDCLTFELKP